MMTTATTTSTSQCCTTLPSHLLWRSLLGSPAAWSGSSSRGVYLLDSNGSNDNGKHSMIQSIPTDGRRMFHLPISLRDAIVGLTIPPLATSSAACHHYHRTEDGSVTRYHQPHDNHRQNRSWNFRQQMSSSASSVSSSATTESMSIIRLLSRPRIVGTASPTSSANNTFYRQSASTAARGGRDMSSLLFPEGGGRIGVRMSDGGGVSCMDLDRGNNVNSFGSSSSSPPRYLLVGSGGGDCSIALYDLSCFGSDAYLYHSTSCSSSSSSSNTNDNSSNNAIISSKNNLSFRSNDPALWTHRPIARSLRQNALSSSNVPENVVVNGVPSGHRHPLRGVHWYPADIYGAFVSVSISGEILVWDAQNFVPVFVTYSHVYSPGGGSDGGKSVATIQCTDLPKSPEGCPHGSALLALGLGGGGGVDSGGGRGGVIQLCDAFRGGSATHELIGHSTNAGGGGGGVNAIAWDPHHPFRLASGGNDCTIRLWDIRKAGAAACLGVLNRESGDTNGRGGYAAEEIYNNPCTSSTRKKQKACISMVGTSRNNISTMNGIESHEAPVTAITFAPYGDDLVSASLDGQIKHWDLRPDSCFTSSFAAVRENNKCTSSNSSVGGGGGDPSVAVGGHLLPTLFYSGDNKAGGCATTPTLPSQRQIRHPNSASLAIIQPGSRTTATLLSTANKNGCSSIGQITGYSLLGRRGKEPGGYPDFVLDGHLADVTCLVPVVGTWDNLAGGRCNDGGGTVAANNRVVFLTGGKDGMVLCWGHSRGCRSRDLVRSISDMSSPSSSSTLHEQKRPLEDVDTW